MADDDPSFEIPRRPRRRYPRRGGVEHEGGTVFSLRPERPCEDPELASLVESVLDAEPYRYGDWFDLPMPLYLVHDADAGDTFRVAVRDGAVELHVLPDTGTAGLRALYDRLRSATDGEWRVERRTD